MAFRYPDLSIKNHDGKTQLEMSTTINIKEILGRVPAHVVDLSPQHVLIMNAQEEEANEILKPGSCLAKEALEKCILLRPKTAKNSTQ